MARAAGRGRLVVHARRADRLRGHQPDAADRPARAQHRGRCRLWEPFSDRCRGVYRIRRNLRKNTWGNQLVFEEANEDLALTFRYGWCNSDRFGFVRRAWLANAGPASVKIRLLDGI